VMMRLWRAVSRFSLNRKSFPLPLAEMPAYALIFGWCLTVGIGTNSS